MHSYLKKIKPDFVIFIFFIILAVYFSFKNGYMISHDTYAMINTFEKIINQKIQLPSGYEIVYGGQFENLNFDLLRSSSLAHLPSTHTIDLLVIPFCHHNTKQPQRIAPEGASTPADPTKHSPPFSDNSHNRVR